MSQEYEESGLFPLSVLSFFIDTMNKFQPPPPPSITTFAKGRGDAIISPTVLFEVLKDAATILAMKGSIFTVLFSVLLRRGSSLLSRGALNTNRTHSYLRKVHRRAESVQSPSVDAFNPIGPPTILSNLAVGETFSTSSSVVTRLSRSPELFHIKNFVSQADREILMHAASNQGMTTAGTKSSEANTIRKDSYLTWLDPYDISGSLSTETLSTARNLVFKSGALFAHETMHKIIQEGGRVDYFFAEDLQVAKYDTNGKFDFHHDGYSRYLTVLAYLNGIGGTYFPFVNTGIKDHDFYADNEASAIESAKKRLVGNEGLLVVGREDADSYIAAIGQVHSGSILNMEAGDAIAFYNYKPDGEKDWRALHCSLPVPQEKWISTCWFRSEALTGPYRHLKKEAMLQHHGN